MPAQIRKTLLHVETTLIEGGRAAPRPLTLIGAGYRTTVNNGGGSANLFMAGADYALSRRTLLYASVGALLRHWLAQGRRLLWFNRAMAAVLVLTAIWMATV